MGETILPADKAAADSPKQRGPDHIWVELSNLKKGDGPFRSLEVDYKVTAGTAGDFTLVIKSEQGRSRVHVILFGDQEDRISVRSFGFQGFPDNCEVWVEVGGGFSPFDRSSGYKVSKSLTMGNVGQLTFARAWKPEEQAAYALEQKARAPAPAPAAGIVLVDVATTPLLPGMPVQGTWMAEWHDAELLSVAPGTLTVKWSKPVDKRPEISTLARGRVAIASDTLAKGRATPAMFTPSVAILAGGTLPLTDDIVPLTSDVKVVPGTPLKAEWAGKWDDVTVTSKARTGEVPIVWNTRKNWSENRKIEMLAIEKETIERLKQPDAVEFFAAKLDELDHQAPERPMTPARDYAIRLAIPRGAKRLKDNVPVPEGTKLRAVWGNQWYTLTVLSDSDEGPVECHWENFNGNWNEWINRGSLVISETEETKLLNKMRAARAKEKSGADEPKSVAGKSSTTATAKPVPMKSAAPSSGNFEVVLEGIGTSKVRVAKVVMEIVEVDLKDALELTGELPIPLKGSLSEEDAEALKAQIEAAGGRASVKAEK